MASEERPCPGPTDPAPRGCLCQPWEPGEDSPTLQGQLRATSKVMLWPLRVTEGVGSQGDQMGWGWRGGGGGGGEGEGGGGAGGGEGGGGEGGGGGGGGGGDFRNASDLWWDRS